MIVPTVVYSTDRFSVPEIGGGCGKKVAGGKGPNVARVAGGPVAGPVTGGAGGPGAFVDPGVRYTDVPAEADPFTKPLEAGY